MANPLSSQVQFNAPPPPATGQASVGQRVHGFNQSWTGASTAEAQTPHLQPGMSKESRQFMPLFAPSGTALEPY